MSKKVSELIKELDITLQELKEYASKMGIGIRSESSSVEDVDVSRIVSTINLMKGRSSDSRGVSNKPKIRATPVINKDSARPGTPVRRPVIPKKAAEPANKAKKPTNKAKKAAVKK